MGAIYLAIANFASLTGSPNGLIKLPSVNSPIAAIVGFLVSAGDR